MVLLCYPKCSTCKATIEVLDKAGIQYEKRDIKLENPTFEELKAWYEETGIDLKKFFNTSGLVYKALNLKERLPSMSIEEQLEILATDGMLVKRPMMIDSGKTIIGKKNIIEKYVGA